MTEKKHTEDPTGEGVRQITDGDFLVHESHEVGSEVLKAMMEIGAALTKYDPKIIMNAVLNYAAQLTIESRYDPGLVFRTFALACHVAADHKLQDEQLPKIKLQ